MAKKAVKKAPTPPSERTHEEAMAFAAATYADDKKAEDIVIMDVQGISPVADYFVICTATSMPHLKAIRNEVKDRFWVDHNRKPIAVDEKMESLWIILHYGDVMVHVFHKEKRDFYALEELWGDAPRVAWAPVLPEPVAPVEKPKKAPATVKKTAVKKAPAKKAAAKKAPAKKAVRKKSA
jgi:ribosome-associated protein